ncbi:hypothetical protein ACG2LH_13795 [Zhouia sp. PK063]|uniref:alpha-1,3-galactosidase-related protein n=1 Tax=Zhouia sp. PK063 TaxID=3373602 RepID=UPI00379D8EDE
MKQSSSHYRKAYSSLYKFTLFYIFPIFFYVTNGNCYNTIIISKASQELQYPNKEHRISSPENSTYFIDPIAGNDKNTGLSKTKAWKSFSPVNRLKLTNGNTVNIMRPGTFHESLYIIGTGTDKKPIRINFAKGEYHFFTDNGYKSKFYISNTNDTPDALKNVAIYIRNSAYVHVSGKKSSFIFYGKTIETCIDESHDIHLENFNLDYHTPTVSEFKVVNITPNFADLKIHKDSHYEIHDSILYWKGDDWKYKLQSLWQVYDVSSKKVYRINMPINDLKFVALKDHYIRMYFSKNPGLQTNNSYQARDITRDYAANFARNSANISWSDVNVYFMHGMGFVYQFCNTISFNNLKVKPNPTSGRTCAAWADILHFSSCKGLIEVKNSYLSAANDDAINVHGVYLRITKKISPTQFKIQYMHSQTYGFMPFDIHDSIEFVNHQTLVPYFKEQVSEIKKLNSKEYIITLTHHIQKEIQENDVVGNSTWMPDVNIKNTEITKIPTRGILVSSSGKISITNNILNRTTMSGILIADDANSWYESGYVTNVLINKNTFIDCGAPDINVHPENNENSKLSVHKNIHISKNTFYHVMDTHYNNVLSAKNISNISFEKNKIVVKEIHPINYYLHFKNTHYLKYSQNTIKHNE